MAGAPPSSPDGSDIRIPRRTFVAVLLVVNMLGVALAVGALLFVPVFMQMLDDMLAGEPVPGITQVLGKTYALLWVLPLTSLILTVVTSRQRQGLAVPAVALVLTFAIPVGLFIFLFLGLFSPLFQLLQTLGGP